jgi:hypothetical protein
MVDVALHKAFTLDEFQWAHAAWELAQGKVQYRDFFEVHFPLAYQYMSLAFWSGTHDPTTIVTMRTMMVPVVMLIALAMWQVNRRDDAYWALLAPILAFSLPSWVARATEIRHDPLGFALFLAAIACLYLEVPSRRVRSFFAGALLALACWSTQKVLVYGVVFFGAAVVDFAVNQRRGRDCLLGDPRFFLAGSFSIVTIIAVQLTLDDNWKPMYQWCLVWAADYQVKQPAFSWFSKLEPMLRYTWWYFGLAGIGLGATLRDLLAEKQPAHPDQLLLLAWVSTWASWALQQAPWSYSAVPFLGMTCVFAARGAARTFARLERLDEEGAASSLLFKTTFTMLFLLAFFRAGTQLEDETLPRDRHDIESLEERYFDEEAQNLQGLPDSAEGLEFEKPTEEDKEEPPDDEEHRWTRFLQDPEWAQLYEPQNEYQLRVLRKVDELTRVDDAIYDNTGTYVSRPHAYWFYYTFNSIWKYESEMLKREVPEALRRNKVVMVLRDSRYPSLPRSVRKFIERHFQPYNGDIWLPGQEYKAQSKLDDEGETKPFKSTLMAPVEGEYFVYPPDVLERAELRVGGKRIRRQIFPLAQGDHKVSYSGPPRSFWILWRPRNDELWHPNEAAKAHFCCRRTTG